MKIIYKVLSASVAAIMYFFLIVKVYQGTGRGVSLPTFYLWSALGWINFCIMFKDRSSVVVPMIYAAGSSCVTFVLFGKGIHIWSMSDLIVMAVVTVCAIIWIFAGKKLAFYAAITAGAAAAVPFIVMTWKAPTVSPGATNTGFMIANILHFLSVKKDGTSEDRLYSGVNVVLSSSLVIPWAISFIRSS